MPPPVLVALIFVRGRNLSYIGNPNSQSFTASLLSTCPPWFAVNDLICSDFSDDSVKYLAPSAVENVFNELMNSLQQNLKYH